ncbi:uncharacterized protein BT62DRAFT_977680 [Guyanagaster necrorhizus]|uniref:Uncharacterized protein n=1 Tax=Guyanagaster necrorhizus TaxID=856835 RepID=A0A9P7W4D7_9AGAR|nr:uncharacterized protein BT62DRAFT_977680 [Guyanagaster necrorhizus MCA 3950]KAG7451904.1 hypothetical protein BT62DRAFT_977680 [Guyanagaster necrorhizus MCA 3950]
MFAMEFMLNKKYANRVLHDVGLCAWVFSSTEAGKGKTWYGDGFRLHYKCPLVVFRPFISEVVLATVKSSKAESIWLTTGLSYISLMYLLQPSAFDLNKRVPDSELIISSELLDAGVASRMHIDAGCVATEGFLVKQESKRALYQIVCSIAESGLDNVSWRNAFQKEAEGDVVVE